MKIFTLIKRITICLVLIIVFQACKCDDDPHYTMGNQSFVTNASSSNNFEIAAGNLAKTKGQHVNVIQYGEHMITDHTAVGAEMATLAKSKGWTIPADLLDKDKANLDVLKNASGAIFDKEFTRIMVASHQDAINLFTMAASNSGVMDDDLRNFARGKLPALNRHLKDALNLQKEVNP